MLAIGQSLPCSVSYRVNSDLLGLLNQGLVKMPGTYPWEEPW